MTFDALWSIIKSGVCALFCNRTEVDGMTEKQNSITSVDGVRAIEMRYRSIFGTDTKKTAFYQSGIRLNTPEMGVLLPERFMPVLESSESCASVFKLALLQTIKAAEKFTDRELDFDWISVFMPIKLLSSRDCVSIITDFTSMLKAPRDRICFEIPPLVADAGGSCRESMLALRKAGFHTMLTGVGTDSFPLLRLAELEPEYVMMNDRVTKMLGSGDRSEVCVKSVISFINELEAEPVASGVSSDDIADKLYDLECSYYTADENTGDRAGSFLQERYVRRKNQD